MISGLLISAGDAGAAPSPAPFAGWERIDPGLRLTWRDRARSSGAGQVSFFLRARDPAAAVAAVRLLGGRVGTVAGDILTVRAPLFVLPMLAPLPQVVELEGARPVRRKLDRLLPEIKADKVQAGQAPLKSGYTGKGVVVGIYDGELDMTHGAFKDKAGKSRVLALWDQVMTTGTPPTGYAYGLLCDAAAISGGTCAHQVGTTMHGTHVTGIAAGAAVSGAPYIGVAPGADIVFVNMGDTGAGAVSIQSTVNANTTATCDGAAFIFSQAKRLGKPAVINMSIGDHLGPHDGSSLASRCLNNLSGPGKIIVASAGNEGAGGSIEVGGTTYNPVVHASGTASATADAIPFISSGQDLQNGGQLGVIVADSAAKLTLRLGVPGQGGAATTWTNSLAVSNGTQSEQTLTVGNATYGALGVEAHVNSAGVQVIYFAVRDSDGDASEHDAIFLLEISGSGKYDAFIDTTSGSGFIQGNTPPRAKLDSSMTIGYPAIAAKVLAVGSHITRNQWTQGGQTYKQNNSATGQQVTVGALSNFSSRGPSRNPALTGNKPDITAPGEIVVSALAAPREAAEKADTPERILRGGKDGYMLAEGTSMASPAVAGVVALMLEADPTLTVEKIRAIFKATAVKPTGVTLPSTSWGVGKLDALAAVAMAAAVIPLPDGSGATTDGGVTPKPAGDDDSCAVSPSSAVTGAPFWFVLGALLLLARARRSRRRS